MFDRKTAHVGVRSRHPKHARLIEDIFDELRCDEDVVGVMLQGSVARGDAFPTSDLDLYILLADGCHRLLQTTERDGILIEQHFGDRERVLTRLRALPMLVYGYLDGHILRDDDGGWEAIRRVASQTLDAYKTPPDELRGTLYWLRSARIKIAAAQDAGDTLRAAFVATTTTWKILEGIWAVNDRPMPPSGAVLAHRGDLRIAPDQWESQFTALVLGDPTERVMAALGLIDWVAAEHE